MMKKLLVLVAVMAMASLASAGIVDVVADGLGDAGHAGTLADPLAAGETIGLKIVLNNNPYDGFPSYDGYVLDLMEVDLNSTNGTLGIVQVLSGKNFVDDLGVNAELGLAAYALAPANLDLKYGSLTQVQAANGVAADLIWNILVTADGTGDINLALVLDGLVNVGDDFWPGVTTPAPSAGWRNATNDDLGGLTLSVEAIPEPMTIALLGLGGLFLRRRK